MRFSDSNVFVTRLIILKVLSINYPRKPSRESEDPYRPITQPAVIRETLEFAQSPHL